MVKRNRKKLQDWLSVILLTAILIAANIAGNLYYERIDLTKEKRFTLSQSTVSLLNQLDDVVFIKVYLEGEFPAGFKRLRNATLEMLDEFRAHSRNMIEYEFINPSESEDPEERKQIYAELVKKGIPTTNLRVKEGDAYSEKIIFPGALVIYKGKELPVNLLENQVGLGPQEVLNNSIQLLEYKFASTIKKIITTDHPTIGFITGHGELTGNQIADFRRTLKDLLFRVETINLRENLVIPSTFDMIVIAKPREKFPETDKFKIDQYLMNGGRILWLVDQVNAELDSLRNRNEYIALNRELNLDDQLFRYGVRVNYDLVQDIFCAQIPLVIGNLGNAPQTDLFPWYYYPVVFSTNTHPIVKNLDAVLFRFASSLDTVKVKGIKKTVLLQSSRYSKALMAPVRIHFNMLREKPDPRMFNEPFQPLAVLLEGQFQSVFKNRLAESTRKMIDTLPGVSFRPEGMPAKMIVIGDGDFIRNETGRDGAVFPLGYYSITDQTFANKDFLLNAVEYLVDDSGLMEARNREVKLRLLDPQRIKSEKLRWQLFNMLVPLAFVCLFGLVFNGFRRKIYS